MLAANERPETPTAIRTDLGAIFVSLELSRSKWLITSLAPGGGEKMSKHAVAAGDVAGMLGRFAELKRKAQARTGRCFPVIVIQEAGLDGFGIDRVLQAEGIESYVVDPASIATSRRRRRAKTDKIDGEALVRALLAYKRGEPRVCAMLRVPTPEEEDRRCIARERKALTTERLRHVNRVKGLLFSQGVSGLRAAAPRPAQATGGTQDRRRPSAACTSEDADRSLGNSIDWNCCWSRSRRSRPNAMPCSLPRRRSRRQQRCCST